MFGIRLLISTSFDRKIKIWNAANGKYIDSLRKGTSEEAQPVSYREKNPGEKTDFTATKNSRSGARKLVGIDLESLKKRVEADPLIEELKGKITKNKLSTEWRLFLSVADIQEQE